MQTISIEDMKAEFDEILAKVQDDPVRVQADGRDVAIILSPDLYAFLLKEPPAGVRPLVAALYNEVWWSAVRSIGRSRNMKPNTRSLRRTKATS